jgi:hypothetical protein
MFTMTKWCLHCAGLNQERVALAERKTNEAKRFDMKSRVRGMRQSDRKRKISFEFKISS